MERKKRGERSGEKEKGERERESEMRRAREGETDGGASG